MGNATRKGIQNIYKPMVFVFASFIIITCVCVYIVFGNGAASAGFIPYPAAAILFLSFLLFCISFYFLAKNINRLKRENRELKAFTERLGVTEERYKTAFEQSTNGIAIFDSHYNILDSNPVFERIAGKPGRDVISASIKDFMEENGQTDSDGWNGFSTTQRFIRPDGSDVWAKIKFTALKKDDKRNYLCVVEDLTQNMSATQALRESERSKAVLLYNLPGMAYRCSYDRDWTMRIVSNGCYELTGYKSDSLVNNKVISYNQLILPQFRGPVWNEWERVLALKTVFKYEYQIKTAAGDTKWVYEQGQGIYDERGMLCALEGLIIDISDRKKSETENQYLIEHDLMTGLHNRAFFQSEKERLNKTGKLPLSIIIANINGIRLINDACGHSEGDGLIVKTAKILKGFCRPGDVLSRTGGDEFSILLPDTDLKTVLELVKTIKRAFHEYDHGISNDSHFLSVSLGCNTKTSQDQDIEQIYRSAEEFMYKQKLLDRKSSHSAILFSIKATLFARSQETEEHAERLAKLSVKMGARLNLPQTKMDELQLFAILHDIGKIGIDDRILNKPDKLSDDEWTIMKKHPEIGFRIAMSSPEFQPVAEYILFHHERWDGKGYPHGLRGRQIPLLSRILAVADAYDAMTENRPYRRAMANQAAMAEIKKHAGTQFDPEVVAIFLENEYKEI